MFRPQTAYPFACTKTYIEVDPPEELADTVCCFWGDDSFSAHPASRHLVIPDVCCDLVFSIDPTTGQAQGHFSGICTQPFWVEYPASPAAGTFGIRFYGWSAIWFCHSSLQGSCNEHSTHPTSLSRMIRDLEFLLQGTATLQDRIQCSIRYLQTWRQQFPVHPAYPQVKNQFLQAPDETSLQQLYAACGYTPRQIQRIFATHIGISPSAFLQLLRYQKAWILMIQRADSGITLTEIALAAGYSDLAHMSRSFKTLHTMSPMAALQYAKDHPDSIIDLL